MGQLARSEDHVHDVLADLVEKMGPRGGAAVGLFPAWKASHPGKTFEDWARIVTAYTVRDYVRRKLGRRPPRRDPDTPSPKRLLNELLASPAAGELVGVRPPFTDAQTARQLLEYAAAHLPADQYAALTLWVQGAEPDDIEEELGLRDHDAGRKLVRAAVAALRRHFAGPENSA